MINISQLGSTMQSLRVQSGTNSDDWSLSRFYFLFVCAVYSRFFFTKQSLLKNPATPTIRGNWSNFLGAKLQGFWRI